MIIRLGGKGEEEMGACIYIGSVLRLVCLVSVKTVTG